MKILIVEDEQLTARNLEKMILELLPDAEIVGIIPSVKDAVRWFEQNFMPDLAFFDIHLSDGSSFSIFEKIDVSCPIIFTTAYDEYALQAFEVNSVDYLLKPVGMEFLRRALEKLKRLSASNQSATNTDLIRKVASVILQEQASYKSSLLISVKDKLIPLPIKDIAYFYFENRSSVAVQFNEKQSVLNHTSLEDILLQLDPTLFFRANRQFIVARSAVKDISIWFGNRIAVNLNVPTPERIIVSRTNVQEFKEWITE